MSFDICGHLRCKIALWVLESRDVEANQTLLESSSEERNGAIVGTEVMNSGVRRWESKSSGGVGSWDDLDDERSDQQMRWQ